MKRLSEQFQSIRKNKTALMKTFSLLLMLVLVVALLPNLQVGARPAMQATNLAVGKPVTCSATPQFPCAEAVDGNVGTRWSSAAGVDPQWLYVDLGTTQSISSVILRWEAAYATAFQIQTSNDAATWTSIYSTTTGTGGTQTLTVSGSGRYVRFYGTARATQWGYSLWEFEIYGGSGPTATRTNTLAPTSTRTLTPVGPTQTLTRTSTLSPSATPGTGCNPTNVAIGKPVAASSTENVGTPATSAVDGNAGTRWSSAVGDPQWFYVDLGSSQSICRVRIVWEPAYATAYQIQTSNDTTTWTTIYSTTTGTGGTSDLTVNGTGRYVRMYGTARATIYGYSFWEFEVYTGTNGPTATATRTNTPVNTPTTGPSLTPSRTFTAVPTSSGGAVMLSYHAPAVASTVQDNANCGGCTADKVTDMSMATRWATEWADPQWIYLDLGATANITRVLLKWEAAYGKSYQIQTSPNATTWTTIYTTTTGDGATDDLTVSGSGRYIRLYATVRGTGYGYSLFEFQVFGTGGAPQATPTPAPTSTPHGPWVLQWSDEFNGPGIDMTNWVYETGCTGNGNGEWENYTNGENSAVQFDSQANSNVLIIEARQTNPTIAACNYSSSRMTTLGKREFTYGRIEARLKLPQTKGIWPAFWMMGNNIGSVGWPYNGEIDIMEHIGSLPNTSSGALHGPGYSGGGNIGGEFIHSEPVNNNYHIYAIEWAPEQIKWYVDNNNFLTITREQVETKGQWVYDHPFFILLNVAVGGAWPGPPDASSQFPQRMYVDYIRVYK